MPRAGRRRKKTRTHVVDNEIAQSVLVSSEAQKVPKSLVIRRGKVESEVAELVEDVRKVMLPYTALRFKEDAKNRKLTLGVYAKRLAMPLGVSHMLVFGQNENRLHLRLARVPEGPTMSFRVDRFSLSKHVRAIQRRPVTLENHHPPVVVTNNFGKNAPPHIKLMRITFQNMFPAINVATVKLSECRRVVLFNLLSDEVVEMRHYAIKATPVGVNKKVRRLIQSKIPNLSRVTDIADYITGTLSSGDASDSEPEDETSRVVLPQEYVGRGNHKNRQSALKLVELGPRLTMRLIKVERGLGCGDVMYHAHVHKTPEEAQTLKIRKEREAQLKMQRRTEQERNVERKRKAKEEKLERKRQRREEREEALMKELRRGPETTNNDNVISDSEEDGEEEEEDDGEEEEEDDDEDADEEDDDDEETDEEDDDF